MSKDDPNQPSLFDGDLDGRTEHFVAGAQKLPTHAVIKNIGKVQILGYHGDGYFHVLDNRDTRRFVHRDRLTFLK